MAAGAYKGLTIRIGADTTNLSNALRGANSAIYKTQGELNKLEKAARIDPGNLNVAANQIGAVAEQAVNAAAKVGILSNGIKQLSNIEVSVGGNVESFAKSLVESGKSITLEAERAKAAYTEVGAALSRIYAEINEDRVSNELKKIDFREITNTGHWDDSFVSSLVKAGEITQEQADAIESLKDKWVETRKALDDYSNASKLGEMNADLADQEARMTGILRTLAESDRYSMFPNLGEQLESVNQRLTLVSAASDTAFERFRRLDAAAKIDPTNIDLTRDRTTALGEAMETAQMEADLLRQKIDAYRTEGIDQLAKGMGNVAVEVEQAENAFHAVNALRNELDETSEAYKQLTPAVEAARERMDTAHAVQQYQNLLTQLREVDAEFVKLSKSITDLSMPSTVMQGIAELSEQLGFLSKATQGAESDAKSLESAMKVNPENIAYAATAMSLLEEAERSAKEEGAILREQLSAFDVSAVRQASDYTKSAATQMLDTASAVDEASAKVRNLNIEIANTRNEIDGIKVGKATGDIDALEAKLGSLLEEAGRADAELEHAMDQFDLSKQRAEVDKLEVKLVKNDATLDRIYTKMHEIGGTSIVPDVDLSDIDRLHDALNDTSVGSSVSQAIEDISGSLRGVSADVATAEGHFRTLDTAMKAAPGDADAIAARTEALQQVIARAKDENELLVLSLGQYTTDKIDAVALATGRVGERAAESRERVDSAFESMDDVVGQIRSKLDEIASMPVAFARTEEGRARIRELTDDIDLLKLDLDDTKAAAADALAGFDTSTATSEAEELITKLEQSNAKIASYERMLDDASGKKLSPEVDLSALDKLNDAYKRLSGGSEVAHGMTLLSSLTKDVGESADTARRKLEELDKAYAKDTGNEDLRTKYMEALQEAIARTKAENDLLVQSFTSYTPDRINEVAYSFRETGAAVEFAQQEYDKAKAEVDSWAEKVKAKQKEISELPIGTGNTEEGRAKIAELEAELDELKQSFDEASKAAGEALGNLNAAKASKELTEVQDKLDKSTDKLVELRSKAEQLSTTDVTPKFERGWDDAIKASEDRFKKLNEAMKLNPGSLTIAAQRASALREVSGAVKTRIAELRDRMNELKGDGIDKAAQRMGNVAEETAKAKKALDDAKKSVSDLQREYDEAAKKAAKLEAEFTRSGKGADEYEKAKQAVGRLKTELEQAKAKMAEANDAANTAAMCSEYKEAQAEVGGLIAKLKELKSAGSGSGGVSAAVVQAASEIGQLMSQAGRKVIESSNEIDSAYRNLRKTFDAEEEEYQNLYDAAMKYSQANVTSADKMLEMEAIAAQLGIGLDGGAAAIQKFAEVSANLDVATDIDAETIALQMGQIVNVMDDLSAEDPETIEGFADALVRMGNTMPAQESSIMQITQRLSAIGDVAHFTTPQLLGWASAIAATGQRSEAAATGISTTITNISKAVSAGGDDLKKWSDLAGQSAEEFANNWRTKPSETLELIIHKLGELGDEGFAELENLDINGVRQTQTLMALAQTVDTVGGAISRAEDAFNGGGDAAREAERKAEGFSGALAKMKNSVQVLSAEFGDAMVPWMEKGTAMVQSLTDFFGKLDDKTKETAVLVGGAFSVFAIAQPILKATFGNALTIIGGFASKAIGVIAGVKAFFVDWGIASLGDAFVVAGLYVENFATKLAPVIKTLGEVVATGKLLTGTFGLIAGAVGIEYAKYIGESMIETSKFNSVLEGLEKTTEGLHGALWNGKEDIDVYGQSWEDLRVDMGDFFSEMEKHNKTNAETRDEATASIGQLERWRQVIDEAAGKGNDFAGSELELKTAIEGVNEVLGTNYEVADVLAGVYVDQTGAVKELRTEIDRLIETKKREIRLSALEDIYKEDVKAQAEAQNAYDKAIAAKQKFLEEWKAENLGTVWKDENQGREIVIDESNWESYARATTEYKLLDQAAEETNAVLKETGEQLDITEKQWEGYADELAFLTSNNFGLREGIMLTNQKVAEAIMENTDWGKSLEEIQPNVKTLAQELENAQVGVTEFQELASEHPDLFAQMVQESGGSIDELVKKIKEWNMARLEEKYGEFDYDEQAFIDAEGNRTEWNEDEWEPIDLKVNDYVSDVLDKVGYNLGEMTNEAGVNLGELVLGLEKAGVSAEQFAGISEEQFASIADAANGDVNAIIAVIAQLNGTPIDDKTAEFHFDEENNLVDAENKQVEWNEETKRWEPVEITAESSVEETVDEAVEYAESEEATVPIDGDASGVEEEAEEAKSKIESEPIQQQVVTNRVDDGATATENVDTSQTVNVSVQTDVTKLDELQQKLDTLKAGVTTTVTVIADTTAAGDTVTALASIPSEIVTNITAKMVNIAGAAKKVADLAESADKLKDVRTSYTASGNAATSATPANNISSLNKAANSMSSKYATYTASGNAATSDAPANRIWNLVNAVNSLPTRKDVTVNYSLNTKGSAPAGAGSSASGAYVPYDKMPRHAAGIFTKPTLTNIGWVGEDGAELYSGNSLIPLTNRKYSMPYINDISDAVARKLGPVEPGPTINITITGVSGPDETADAIERKLRLLGF